jgi:predicted DNA-binding transcriptional regulator AlpA
MRDDPAVSRIATADSGNGEAPGAARARPATGSTGAGARAELVGAAAPALRDRHPVECRLRIQLPFRNLLWIAAPGVGLAFALHRGEVAFDPVPAPGCFGSAGAFLSVNILHMPAKLDLVGLAEVAELLKTSRTQANRWARREDFPEPVANLRATPVWRRSDVQRWAKRRKPDGRRKR